LLTQPLSANRELRTANFDRGTLGRVEAKELGRRGERRAAWFYRLRGYAIVARNVRFRGGEIDLVVRRGRVLAFVEVKTRQSLAAGEGYEAVDRAKKLQLVRLSGEYLARHPHSGDVRYDVLSLRWTGLRFIVKHFHDAFRPVRDARRPWRWTV
jgi:putative endonuclease